MPARIFHEDFDEAIIWGDDGSLVGEESGREVTAEIGDTFETEDGRDFEWREAHAESTPDHLWRETTEAQHEAAERAIDWHADQEARQYEQEVEAEELDAEIERADSEAALDSVEARKAANLNLYQQIKRTEQRVGRTLTTAERQELAEHGPALIYPDKSIAEEVQDAVVDDQADKLDGLVPRSTATALVTRTGVPQDYSYLTVKRGTYDDGSDDLVTRPTHTETGEVL